MSFSRILKSFLVFLLLQSVLLTNAFAGPFNSNPMSWRTWNAVMSMPISSLQGKAVILEFDAKFTCLGDKGCGDLVPESAPIAWRGFEGTESSYFYADMRTLIPGKGHKSHRNYCSYELWSPLRKGIDRLPGRLTLNVVHAVDGQGDLDSSQRVAYFEFDRSSPIKSMSCHHFFYWHDGADRPMTFNDMRNFFWTFIPAELPRP